MSDDIVARLADEIERLQERCTEQAHWIDAAVSKCATQQCSRRAAQLLELQAEIKRLHADKRTLIDQLRHIRTHLYAATVQRSPADDKIIADHVEQAYLRANEVIAEMEKTDD